MSTKMSGIMSLYLPTTGPYLDSVQRFFDEQPNRISAPEELYEIYRTTRDEWKIPRSIDKQLFVTMLINHTSMHQLKLQSSHSTSPTRYAWTPDPHPIIVASSLMKRRAIFPHASALWIHRLGENTKDIFVNKEQSEKPRPRGEGIDRAFRNQQRYSTMCYTYKESKIT